MNSAEMAALIVEYMRQKEYKVFNGPGEVNIVYFEGANIDLTPNSDAPDMWNDRGLLICFPSAECPVIVANHPATTEPGIKATNSRQAQKLGGVARIAIGQHWECWQMGFHKGDPNHPALVQCAPIKVFRDVNRDGKRTGDPIAFAHGINQHSTKPGIPPKRVGNYSAGCLVRQDWEQHQIFLSWLKDDLRFVADKKFRFSATIIDASDFAQWLAKKGA